MIDYAQPAVIALKLLLGNAADINRITLFEWFNNQDFVTEGTIQSAIIDCTVQLFGLQNKIKPTLAPTLFIEELMCVHIVPQDKVKDLPEFKILIAAMFVGGLEFLVNDKFDECNAIACTGLVLVDYYRTRWPEEYRKQHDASNKINQERSRIPTTTACAN